jgi:hypothetical protein
MTSENPCIHLMNMYIYIGVERAPLGRFPGGNAPDDNRLGSLEAGINPFN